MRFLLFVSVVMFYSCSQPTEQEKLVDLVRQSNQLDEEIKIEIVDTIKVDNIESFIIKYDTISVDVEAQVDRLPDKIKNQKKALSESEESYAKMNDKMLKKYLLEAIEDHKKSIVTMEEIFSKAQILLAKTKTRIDFFENALDKDKNGDVFYVVKCEQEESDTLYYIDVENEFVDYPI